MTRVRARHDLAALPVSAAITTRRKELSATDTVADARRLFARDSVRVLPVLDGGAYVGVVTRDALDDVDPETPVVALTSESVPVALAGTPSAAAFTALDRSGSTRLVVVEDDGVTYRGLVCLRTDRERVCVDAECHAEPDLPIDERNTLTTISPDTHVSALVLEEPGRARVFERFGIDYCCGGETPLEEACAQRDLDVVAVIAALDESRSPEAGDVDWTAVPLSALADHIVEEHHAYLRQELPPLTALVEKVARAHGDVHAELEDVRDTFAAIAAELSEHMVKEEQIVFPACVALEAGNVGPGSIEAPIQVMVHEHDEVAAGLARLRELTTGYEPPADACNSYRAMLDRLQTLELDTHRHVHKENNVLFPRALALASGA
jgi:regulator of cell morphogenesis and NO signaling